MWTLPSHISISLTSEESPGLKQKPLIHLAHLNRQYPNAVSIAGGHRNTSFLTRGGSCILPPTNNSLEDTDSILQAQTSQLYPNFCSLSPTRLNITAAACSRLGFDAVLEMAGKHRLPCWTAAEKSHSFCQITESILIQRAHHLPTVTALHPFAHILMGKSLMKNPYL